MWVGVGASDTEKQGAQELCGILGVTTSEIAEGGESGKSKLGLYSGNMTKLHVYSFCNEHDNRNKTCFVDVHLQ